MKLLNSLIDRLAELVSNRVLKRLRDEKQKEIEKAWHWTQPYRNNLDNPYPRLPRPPFKWLWLSERGIDYSGMERQIRKVCKDIKYKAPLNDEQSIEDIMNQRKKKK